MQQIALPSLFNAPLPRGTTIPFPLVRRVPPRAGESRKLRRFVAGSLFMLLMAGTLALLGYEARIYSDGHPNLANDTLAAIRGMTR